MNKYLKLSPDQYEEHISNFMIPHFSHSCLEKFTSNPLVFHKNYISKQYDNRRGVSALAGNAYHYALQKYFEAMKEKQDWELDQLYMAGYEYMEQLKAFDFDLGKKYEKTGVEPMKIDIEKILNKVLKNFWVQKDEYLDNIQEVIEAEAEFFNFLEFKYQEVDIPLPCKLRVDTWYIDKDGYVSFDDHKSTKTPSTTKEALIKYSFQAILTAMNIEAEIEKAMNEKLEENIVYQMCKKYPKMKEGVKRCRFIENKTSDNRDNTPQIVFHEIDLEKGRPMYEALLGEKILNFFKAISDPDYIFLPNFNDPFCNIGEMMDYWIKIYTGDLEEFDALDEHVKVKIIESRKKNQNIIEKIKNIPKEFLETVREDDNLIFKDMEKMTPTQKIEFRLRTLSVPCRVQHVVDSYSCLTYLLEPEAGVSANQIISKRIDIAQSLGVESIRVSKNLVVRDEKSFISIETNKPFKQRTFPKNDIVGEGVHIGVSTLGDIVSWNPEHSSTPHLMIAGSTGSGKSVLINSILTQYKTKKVTIIDPKFEFTSFPESYQDMDGIVLKLNQLVDDMDILYKKGKKEEHLLIFDEASDVLSRTKMKDYKGLKTPKDCLLILAQKGRACGLHIVLASQRITAKLFDGDVKANFTARVCLTTASSIDSRVMLEEDGAESLGGYGDALYIDPNYKEPIRIQCFS